MNAVEEKEKGREKEKEWATNGSGKQISLWKLRPKRDELRVDVDWRLALGETKVCWGKWWQMTIILRWYSGACNTFIFVRT